jgi:peptidoglycan DL-endopeptidase CwlO
MAGPLEALAQPIIGLVDTFGSGLLAAGGPADALVSASSAVDAGHDTHRAGIGSLTASWSGPAADAAVDRAGKVQQSAAHLSDRGASMAGVVREASADVQAGVKKLEAIVQDFLRKGDAVLPLLFTPGGIFAMVGLAQDHLRQGLTVVAETRAKLDRHTDSMRKLAPDPRHVPNPVSSSTDVAAALARLSQTAAAGAQAVGHGFDEMTDPMAHMQELRLNQPQTAAAGMPQAIRLADGGVAVQLPDGRTVVAPNPQAAKALQAALGQIGTPYVWGGTAPGRGLDCSGLTQYAYREAGLDLPRTAQNQNVGQFVGYDENNAQPGDLLVWDGHVAMYAGDGQIVEAPHTGETVHMDDFRTSNAGDCFYGIFRPSEA